MKKSFYLLFSSGLLLTVIYIIFSLFYTPTTIELKKSLNSHKQYEHELLKGFNSKYSYSVIAIESIDNIYNPNESQKIVWTKINNNYVGKVFVYSTRWDEVFQLTLPNSKWNSYTNTNKEHISFL